MGQVSITGLLIVGPDSTTVSFPGSETSIPLIGSVVDYAVASPGGLMSIDSADAYVPVPGVGTDGPVTAGRLLYVRTDRVLLLRVTTTAGVSVIPVDGLCLIEISAAAPLTALEAQGIGRLEYLVAGQS